MNQATYKDAGVDLDLYRKAMQRIPAFIARTRRPGVIDMPGGFAGLFRLNQDRRPYADPVLVSGTDGVGTKIKIAAMTGRCTTVGIDLVAMCVNDCLCLGAEPLFFLDYLALGRDDPDRIAELVDGVSRGCEIAGAALLGGETAIMPDLYADDDFDMAGFCVGVVERERIVDGTRSIRAGDVVVGIASGGFHSNGYSLIRKVVFDMAGLSVGDAVPEIDGTVGDVLLRPTRIYSKATAAILTSDHGPAVHGIAHITGGGLAENIERILPTQCRVTLDRGTWNCPPEFPWVDRLGNVGREEMFRVFNMGIGLAIVVDSASADAICRLAIDAGETASIIGHVTSGECGVVFTDE